ncbi:hypothetical protein L6Q21_11040 [Sandaracinobacter sp. RS1-74]|uniref:hypothetical protein n=1 Tax=Sandaracinobacteroides sayramensis TaxID=2913411 RepID=UPI001ED9E9EC|nr:hypothetical protein [Sandaracinobacteroides sayramensis]MCG2841515.1 hypothetical protein [Sandaracinobacteroides sayramensis]
MKPVGQEMAAGEAVAGTAATAAARTGGPARPGEGGAARPPPAAARTGGPARPGEGETILWQGRPAMLTRKLLELIGFLLLLGLLSWFALELIRPHLAGSAFAGQPTAGAVPLVLGMVLGMMLIIALPVWLRSSARARARYMLTNRRALVWLGDRIVGEALLFGADMRASGNEVSFEASRMVLSWRLKDEGADRLRFEQIPDALAVAALAEEHGARWLDRPETPPGNGPDA